MHSCMYVGSVRHRRRSDVTHQFCYRLWWSYLDLGEMATLVQRGLLSKTRWGKAAFCAQRHQKDRPTDSMTRSDRPVSSDSAVGVRTPVDSVAADAMDLSVAIRDAVQKKAGWRPEGPIRMLTQLTHFGVYFSPLTIFYVFDDSERLVASVAEVNNTPWGEQHNYVLTGQPSDGAVDWGGGAAESWEGSHATSQVVEAASVFSAAASSTVLSPTVRPELKRCEHPKTFHVSPFFDVNGRYDFTLMPPGRTVSTVIDYSDDGGPLLTASFSGTRSEFTDQNLLTRFWSHPLVSLKVIGGIHWEALKLARKRVGFRRKPEPPTNPVTNVQVNETVGR